MLINVALGLHFSLRSPTGKLRFIKSESICCFIKGFLIKKNYTLGWFPIANSPRVTQHIFLKSIGIQLFTNSCWYKVRYPCKHCHPLLNDQLTGWLGNLIALVRDTGSQRDRINVPPYWIQDGMWQPAMVALKRIELPPPSGGQGYLELWLTDLDQWSC